MKIDNKVIDSSSIQVSRRRRRAKTDSLDADALVCLLRRFVGGEQKVFKVVRVPSPEAEDERRPLRELDRLTVEQGSHSSRIKSLLATIGVQMKVNTQFDKRLAKLKATWTEEQQRTRTHLLDELQREWSRWMLLRSQKQQLQQQMRDRVLAQAERDMEATTPGTPTMMSKVVKLLWLCGIGEIGSWTLVLELFGWRTFKNRREVGALPGLTPTPYDSGGSRREQGISKAGPGRIRKLLNQLAWGWLRYQPGSALTQWFNERFAKNGSRSRRSGIVALSRKLLIALWRYVEKGIVPEGAQLKTKLLVPQA